MVVKMSEAELEALGFVVDPDDPTTALPISEKEQPDDSWSVDRLMRYGSASIAESSRLEKESIVLARRSTVQVFRAGHALSIAHEKASVTKSWVSELRNHGIARTTAWEAIELYRRAKIEEAVASRTITEAKQAFGVTKPKRGQEDEDHNDLRQHEVEGDEEEDNDLNQGNMHRVRQDHESEHDDVEEDEHEHKSDVRRFLELATEYLDNADGATLPVHDEGELNQIIAAAEECESKAARVLAKVQELVAVEPAIISDVFN